MIPPLRRNLLSSICYLLPIAYLWWRLVDHLRIEWTVNPQYAYGWAVPFLCAYLVWRRACEPKREAGRLKIEDADEAKSSNPRLSSPIFHLPSPIFYVVFALCAFLYAPTRLIQEANPDWRLVSWALALEVVGITLLTAHAVGDGRWKMGDGTCQLRSSIFDLRSLAFPLCFFLIAVPWPTVLETSVVQTLTQANVAATTEIANLFGIPAMQRGNVIEVSTGLVGIDEACSGIRSLQATLMIALFLGELYRLSVLRRLTLCVTGFLLSFVFNIGRTVLLVTVAAKDGLGAMERWHDPAGVTILVGCFTGLWIAGVVLRRKSESRKQKAESKGEMPEAGEQMTEGRGQMPEASRQRSGVSPRISGFSFQFSVFLLLWLAFVEIGTQLWYRAHERDLSPPIQWAVRWPKDVSGFKELTIAERARQLLRYDVGQNAQWQSDGEQWQVIYLRWNPGRIAAHLARSHTPEVCLTAAGHELKILPGLKTVSVQGMKLPFRAYSFPTAQGPVFVFYCLWEDRQREQIFDTESLTAESRMAAVRAGRRNLGQRSLEVAVSGMPDAAAAELALAAQLVRLVVVEQPRLKN